MKKAVLILVLILAITGTSFEQNPRNVVLYNLTSTGCGPCSCMDSIIRHSLLVRYPNTVVIALHSPTTMGGSYFWEYQGSEIFNQFHSLWDPDGFIDGLGHDVFYRDIADSVGKRLAEASQSPVKIELLSKSWNPGTRMVDMNVRLTNIGGDLPGSYWCNIFVTEDNLQHVHRIQYGCATPDDPNHQPLRNNYFNDHVTRKVEFLVAGDSVIGPSWPAGQEVLKNFSVKIDDPWIAENTYLNLVVYHRNDSIYKSEVQQAIRQSATGAAGIPRPPVIPELSRIINVWPNPATNLVNIHFSVAQAGDCKLELISADGRQITVLVDQRLEPGLYNIENMTGALLPGNYLVRLQTSSGKSIEKLVLTR